MDRLAGIAKRTGGPRDIAAYQRAKRGAKDTRTWSGRLADLEKEHAQVIGELYAAKEAGEDPKVIRELETKKHVRSQQIHDVRTKLHTEPYLK